MITGGSLACNIEIRSLEPEKFKGNLPYEVGPTMANIAYNIYRLLLYIYINCLKTVLAGL